ncbi:MAG: DUF5615 family PIN-like protein [Acidobacteriota bacterium]|nr:DUF5615 family PIN-like protein [Acidobacteriota bacterium]
MLRLLIDQNFDHDILRGLERRISDLDYVTTGEMGLSQTRDPELLKWAAAERRVILTHDQSTMPDHVPDRLSNGQDVFGVLIVPSGLPIGVAINELEWIIDCSEEDEYQNRYLYLPL